MGPFASLFTLPQRASEWREDLRRRAEAQRAGPPPAPAVPMTEAVEIPPRALGYRAIRKRVESRAHLRELVYGDHDFEKDPNPTYHSEST